MDQEEAKCPMGFTGGINPHEALSGGKEKKQNATDDSSKPIKDNDDDSPSKKSSSESATEKGARCPWPFIFFHDPATGMRDWQTWVAIGLVSSWCWSRVGGGNAQ
mmetsp:Transcript_22755/g.36946  ORF Transcript_22755/g.36946 Transcript_22755/m.36946 type:complete len:105 (+) Transcript_22755:140-454(+)|eukprot:CAMPEP_0196131058 /NCGR_PEP_ID=MMETSP0910-20130528/1212_1 /TAXON_ID=49265 /ORGANISM="Thalassiosira rotula, Strain GSO102" /LENGTH=104 /DNA_ID=CAMNT_0041390477 /DNA_START=133 /DNA_END=447 /DNA_ORIENTATION=+